MSWSWYALAPTDRQYRALPFEITLGPDLAQPLRPIWGVLECHAERLERLTRQLSRVRLGLAEDSAALVVEVPLVESDETIRVILAGKEVRYLVVRDGNAQAADLPEPRVDQGVYLLLAELAAR
ncbi:MAG: hypothetical protein ACJ8C4_04675 [Gemmataceae bacterium]